MAQLSSDRTSGRFPLAIYDGVEPTNGEILVRFKPVSGPVDQAAGIVWRYRDPDNYYIVRANALEHNAFAEYYFNDAVTVRAGEFIKPFGFDIQHSSSVRESRERGVFAGYFFPAQRDRGLMISADLRRVGRLLAGMTLMPRYSMVTASSMTATTTSTTTSESVVRRPPDCAGGSRSFSGVEFIG